MLSLWDYAWIYGITAIQATIAALMFVDYMHYQMDWIWPIVYSYVVFTIIMCILMGHTNIILAFTYFAAYKMLSLGSFTLSINPQAAPSWRMFSGLMKSHLIDFGKTHRFMHWLADAFHVTFLVMFLFAEQPWVFIALIACEISLLHLPRYLAMRYGRKAIELLDEKLVSLMRQTDEPVELKSGANVKGWIIP